MRPTFVQSTCCFSITVFNLFVVFLSYLKILGSVLIISLLPNFYFNIRLKNGPDGVYLFQSRAEMHPFVECFISCHIRLQDVKKPQYTVHPSKKFDHQTVIRFQIDFIPTSCCYGLHVT